MKKILLVFVLLFTVSSLTYSQDDIAPAKPEIKGKVKQIRTYSTLQSGNGFAEIGKRNLTSIETFDYNGQPMDFGSYHNDSIHVLEQQHYYYDNKRKKIGDCFELRSGSPRPADGRTIYIYDSNRLIARKQITSDNVYYFAVVYKYDDLGRKIEETKFEDSGSIIYSRKFFTYSMYNKVIEAKEYWNIPGDEKKSGGGNQLKYEGKRIFSYNDAGELIQKEKVGFDDEVHEVFIMKDRDCVDSIGARVTAKTVYKYDNSGLLIEEGDYDKEGQVIYTDTYKYSDFDQVGNWCKQTSYSTSFTSTCKTTVRLTERKIEYY